MVRRPGPRPQRRLWPPRSGRVFGKIFRRNMPYGTIADHGTMFVGFSADQRPLATMLESMAGVTDGVPDAPPPYTKPVTGAYYFVPSTQSIRSVSGLASPV